MERFPHLRDLLSNKAGATAVEYGMLAALVVLAAFAGMRALADESTFMWAKVATNVLGSANKPN